MSKLSVWWLRLGIGIERIKPGNPQQNGRHERMHLTLKKEATRPAGKNFLQQQSKFDDFMQEYNHERPHQALGMKYPAELYSPSVRPYRGLTEPQYPFHDRTVLVTHCGRICIGKRKISLSHVFAGQLSANGKGRVVVLSVLARTPKHKRYCSGVNPCLRASLDAAA